MNKALQLVNKQYFRNKILLWHRSANTRKMPWKGEKDPYKVWLSEIILQQTRVEQGLKYYEKFILKYPIIQKLAAANDDDVFKNWEGLGYYSRCRNLLFTARHITENLNGKFPDKFEDILELKGVGQYTASAIASFAFHLPRAVVDGNVIRVLSRFLASDSKFQTAKEKLFYQTVADAFLSKKYSAEYNQGIMDFGATVCKPQNPLCETCPLKKKCEAFLKKEVHLYPVKKTPIKIKKRTFHYIIVDNGKQILLRKREGKDIWQALYEPILVEQESKPKWLKGLKPRSKKLQKLSHQHLTIYFYILNNTIETPINTDLYKKISYLQLSKKAYPKSIYEFLKEFDYI